MLRLTIVVLFASATIGSWAARPAAAALELVPHRAIYAVSLADARSGSGIVTVSGEMLADWSETCEGWTLDHRSLLEVTFAPGRALRLKSTVATWESRDGLDYRFNVSNTANDHVTESIEGRATLTARGGAGKVVYDAPAGRIDQLPEGTVFPTAHSQRILAAAEKAPTILNLPVFDGMTLEGALSISAFLGRANPPAAIRTGPAKVLSGRRSWPLRMSFYPLAGGAAEPTHEIGMKMYDNGIGEDLLLDFGDFTVRAKLIRLEMSDRPSCGS